jgi:hypothetical protein
MGAAWVWCIERSGVGGGTRSTMPAFNAADVDVAAPDSLPHTCTRSGAERVGLGQSAEVARITGSAAEQPAVPLERLDQIAP